MFKAQEKQGNLFTGVGNNVPDEKQKEYKKPVRRRASAIYDEQYDSESSSDFGGDSSESYEGDDEPENLQSIVYF